MRTSTTNLNTQLETDMTTTESPTATWPGIAGSVGGMRRRIPNLIRLAGLCAVLAGLCYVSVGVFHPANELSSVTTTRWAVVHVLACAMSFFGVLGMTGIHVRQAAKTGWLGLLGFALLSLWLVIIMGFSFVEAFALPHLATLTPSFVDGWMGMFNGTGSKVNMGILPTLWTLTAPIYILGGLSFGIATFRARIFPRGAAVLLAIGTTLAPLAAALLPLASQPKMAIPAGLALAWLGYALLSERRNSLAAQRDDHSDQVKA
jgi:hypothetical protein